MEAIELLDQAASWGESKLQVLRIGPTNKRNRNESKNLEQENFSKRDLALITTHKKKNLSICGFFRSSRPQSVNEIKWKDKQIYALCQ